MSIERCLAADTLMSIRTGFIMTHQNGWLDWEGLYARLLALHSRLGMSMFSTKRLTSVTIVIAALLSPAIALSQVYKCVDASGKTTFSDQGCAGNNSATTVELGHINTQDSSQYQQRILDDRFERSQPKKQLRVTVVGDGRQEEQQARARKDLCKEANTPYKGAQNRQLTARQRDMAAGCSAGRSTDEIIDISNKHKMSAPPPPAPPSHTAPSGPAQITNCDAGGCWDTQSQRYNQGAGSTHFRQDGRICEQVGQQMQCR